MIFDGTCRMDVASFIFFSILLINGWSNLKLLFIVTNNIIRTSSFQIWPTTTDSFISSKDSTTLYISAVPILIPPGLRVASDLP